MYQAVHVGGVRVQRQKLIVLQFLICGGVRPIKKSTALRETHLR